MQAFSSCGRLGLLFAAVRGLLTAVASLVTEHKLQGVRASVDVAHGHSCSLAGGIFQDQGLSPCLLQCQVDFDSL